MANTQIPVGDYEVWTVNLTNAANTGPDTTSTILFTSSPPGKVTLDPVSGTNNQVYVTGTAAQANLTLIATDPRGRQVFQHVDVTAANLSTFTDGGFGPVLAGPHP